MMSTSHSRVAENVPSSSIPETIASPLPVAWDPASQSVDEGMSISPDNAKWSPSV